MPRNRKAEGKPESGRALSSLLTKARDERKARRYRKACMTCCVKGAPELIAESIRAVLSDRAAHRGVSMTDIFGVVRQKFGVAIADNTFLSHVRSHEADLYAEWQAAGRG